VQDCNPAQLWRRTVLTGLNDGAKIAIRPTAGETKSALTNNYCCESVASIYFAAGSDIAADGGVVVIGCDRLQAARHFSVA